jgi:hypothetical protein
MHAIDHQLRPKSKSVLNEQGTIFYEIPDIGETSITSVEICVGLAPTNLKKIDEIQSCFFK